MNKKVILLSRVSTEVQHLESQTNDLIREAERLGYSKENQIIIESKESAIKLAESEREGIQQLKKYIEEDKDIDCVICWEPSRLSRQQAMLYNLRDYLLKNKIQLYILNPYVRLLNEDRTQIDTTASIVFSLFATLSENEMMIKKERFLRAKNELKRNGKKFSGATTFGYIKDKDKNCIPHPVNSQIIIKLFNYYIEHDEASLYDVYKYATSNWPELFPVTEYTKAQHKIRHIFDTPIYATGNWCYPPIISEETMKLVKEKMGKAVCKSRYNSKLEFLGRGKVRCGHCGNIMTGCGGNVNAYICSTDKLHSLQMNNKILDWLIWEEVKVAANIAASIDNSSKVIEIDKIITEKKNLLNQQESYINELKLKQDKLVSLYLDDKISKDIYDKRYSELSGKLKSNEDDYNKIQVQINELQQSLHNQQISTTEIVNYDNVTNFQTKLEMVHKYLKDVVLYKADEDKTLMIEFNWKLNLVIPRSKYKYTGKGGNPKIYRINEDETVDLIYNKR